ncbi:TPA: hypothetical protein ACOQ5T_003367, partial [Bacillus cereus]
VTKIPQGELIEAYYKFAKSKEGGFSNGNSRANKVNILESSIKHSNVGDFTTHHKTGDISKMKGGGHGQSNIEFLEKNNVDYNINKVYENGVRVGVIKTNGEIGTIFPDATKQP